MDSLEPLNVDESTHLWRARLHKVLEMCFLTQTVKRSLSNAGALELSDSTTRHAYNHFFVRPPVPKLGPGQLHC